MFMGRETRTIADFIKEKFAFHQKAIEWCINIL